APIDKSFKMWNNCNPGRTASSPVTSTQGFLHAVLFCSLPAVFLLLSGCANPQGVEPYHASLTSVGARFGALPSAVQNSIRAQTGAADISDIEIDNEMRSVGTVYKITYMSDALYPPLFVATDGSIINPDMTVAVGAAHDATAVLKGGAA